MIITGNTYPVKEQLKALGGKWDKEAKGWSVPDSKAAEAQKLVAAAPVTPRDNKKPFVHYRCKQCGAAATRYNKIYRNGVCRDCYVSEKEEAEMGY